MDEESGACERKMRKVEYVTRDKRGRDWKSTGWVWDSNNTG